VIKEWSVWVLAGMCGIAGFFLNSFINWIIRIVAKVITRHKKK
jgi:hypothetical protein